MDIYDILRRCDHTLLRPGCTAAEIMALCDEAAAYRAASVCIPPCHVAGARGYLDGRVPVCTVIGFPNGYASTASKAFEASDAVKNGADEIDMVINLSLVKDACWEDLSRELDQVRAFTQGHVLKVIIETCQLTREEKEILCSLVTASGADFIKTSTGFSTGGATVEDVALLRACCGGHVRVKASGGISTFEQAEALIAAGADRLGTSRLIPLAVKSGVPAPEELPAQQAAERAGRYAYEEPIQREQRANLTQQVHGEL